VLVTLFLVAAAVEERPRTGARPHIDGVGAALAALALGGTAFALVRQPDRGWGAAVVWAPLAGGLVALAAFLRWEAGCTQPMLPLSLFKRRNFAAGNAETLLMYGGLSVSQFLVVLFLQEQAGYSAVEAGTALLPTTLVMFTLSRRMGALADRFGPRRFMGFGPLVAACGLVLYQRVGRDASYAPDVLPAVLVFAVGLSMTVAPLTATVLADADARNAGIASGVNNAIARVAALLGVALVGVIVGKHLTVPGFHHVMLVAAALVALGGVIGLVGIRDPSRELDCEHCPGGALTGAPAEAAREPVTVGAA
jgi:predicted MFS family arabinose efflux permease